VRWAQALLIVTWTIFCQDLPHLLSFFMSLLLSIYSVEQESLVPAQKNSCHQYGGNCKFFCLRLLSSGSQTNAF
jgi:hypothetical protein